MSREGVGSILIDIKAESILCDGSGDSDCAFDV
jgi:hypothetical protein